MPIGNNLSVFTGSLFAAGPVAKKDAKKPAKQLEDVGPVTFTEKTYPYSMPDLDAKAILTVTSSNFSDDKTASLSITWSYTETHGITTHGGWKTLDYKIMFNKTSVGYFPAHISGSRDDQVLSYNHITTGDKEALSPIFARLENMEKDPLRLQLIQIMHKGVNEMKPVD